MFHAYILLAALCGALLIGSDSHAASNTALTINAELGTSIAADLFPVTLELNPGNVFLTEPALLFLDQRRLGLRARFQAYDHRPQRGIAISETGLAQLSGELDYDPVKRQVLLLNPRIDNLQFDRDNEVTRHFRADMQEAWSAQVANPLRASLPPHPYLLPFRNNIQDLSYDGNAITVLLSYE